MKMKITTRIVIWILTLAICFIILWPVMWIVKSSFTTNEKLFEMPVHYLPDPATLDNYRILITGNRQVNSTKYLVDTLILSTGVLTATIVLCSLAGYGFARGRSKGTGWAYKALLFTSMVPATCTMVPLLILWRKLSLTDTMPGLILLYVSAMIPFSTTMFYTYIQQIPASLEEAAQIDGSGMLGAFFHILFPLLTPIIATLCIINFINCINEFFTPLLFTTKKVRVLSQVLFNVPRRNQYEEPWGVISAAGCIMLAPTTLFILFFEKQIMSGLMMGSIKQ